MNNQGTSAVRPGLQHEILTPNVSKPPDTGAVYTEKALADQYADLEHCCYDDKSATGLYGEFEHMCY